MLFRSPEQASEAVTRPVVAIGNFDGVHLGHEAVIAQAIAEAERRHVDPAVLTFEPHPIFHFRPDTPEFRLTTLTQKAQRLAELGVRAVVAVSFDSEMASRTPEQFVQEILVDALHASAVLVGDDFRFGKGRVGNIATLRELCGDHGLDVVVLAQVRSGSTAISSTRVRIALSEADLNTVTSLLGRPYTIDGTVVQGDQLGRTFGFPTANIASENGLLPPDGIYATRLWDETYGEFDAATYVGTRPAVGGTQRVVEAFCLDVPDQFDLYGHRVELEFVGHVRADSDFEGTDALIAQMHRDVATARELLKS